MQDGIYTTDVTVKVRTYHSDIMAAHRHARDESIRIAVQQRSEGKKHVTGIYVWKQNRGFRGSTDIWTDGKCAGFAGAYDPLAGEGYAEQVSNRERVNAAAKENYIATSAKNLIGGVEKMLASH